MFSRVGLFSLNKICAGVQGLEAVENAFGVLEPVLYTIPCAIRISSLKNTHVL